MDLARMLAVAQGAVDEAEAMFIAGLGADPAEIKNPGDFATEVDLEIEATLREHLSSATGIGVIGEEGGGELDPAVTWVVDPIDGTSNYAAGSPLCAILVSLVVAGQPRVAVTSMPLLRQRLTSIEGAGVELNGRAVEGIVDRDPLVTQVGLSSITHASTIMSVEDRMSIIRMHSAASLRPRIFGSVGIELAAVARGVLDGAVSFSPHPWDNAAGVAHVRANGGVVTDLEGREWSPDSHGVVAGTPRVHAALLDTLARVRG